jgi:3-oxoacyl-[acyl-carrier-protein] synthase-1
VIKRDVLRGLAPNSLYAYCAMLQAIEDARLAPEDISNLDTGLYAASGGSPYLTHYHHKRMEQLGVLRCSPLGIVASIAGTLNFNLVATFKIHGASCGFSSACASSSHALGFAYEEIVSGRQKRMFVAGAEDCNTDSILPFAGMRALSLQTNPDLASRPFDASRDGFVGTGGGAVLVIESEEEVERRGVRTYAEMAGWGQASDGYNVAISHPEGCGLSVAMTNAFRYSGIEPAAVDYVNAHATSTPIGDTSEAKALKAVFKDAAVRPAISSTKALTGHGLSVAGAMETAFCAIAVKEGFMPGSAHITRLDPACEGLNIIRTTISQQPHVVLNNSSGFGGANVCIVVRQA